MQSVHACNAESIIFWWNRKCRSWINLLRSSQAQQVWLNLISIKFSPELLKRISRVIKINAISFLKVLFPNVISQVCLIFFWYLHNTNQHWVNKIFCLNWFYKLRGKLKKSSAQLSARIVIWFFLLCFVELNHYQFISHNCSRNLSGEKLSQKLIG